jgi:hypothetical protein
LSQVSFRCQQSDSRGWRLAAIGALLSSKHHLYKYNDVHLSTCLFKSYLTMYCDFLTKCGLRQLWNKGEKECKIIQKAAMKRAVWPDIEGLVTATEDSISN